MSFERCRLVVGWKSCAPYVGSERERGIQWYPDANFEKTRERNATTHYLVQTMNREEIIFLYVVVVKYLYYYLYRDSGILKRTAYLTCMA